MILKAKITFEDKVALNENVDIPEINKVTDENINEIKRVVNENADTYGGGETLPVGTEVDYDGTEIPAGWEQINDKAKILWTNPNPTNIFSTQEITLSNDNYDCLIWIYRFHTGDGNNIQKSQLTLKGAGALMDCAWDYGVGGNYYVADYYRKSTYNSDTVFTISDCNVKYNNSSNTVANNFCIPVAVYGIRF